MWWISPIAYFPYALLYEKLEGALRAHPSALCNPDLRSKLRERTSTHMHNATCLHVARYGERAHEANIQWIRERLLNFTRNTRDTSTWHRNTPVTHLHGTEIQSDTSQPGDGGSSKTKHLEEARKWWVGFRKFPIL